MVIFMKNQWEIKQKEHPPLPIMVVLNHNRGMRQGSTASHSLAVSTLTPPLVMV